MVQEKSIIQVYINLILSFFIIEWVVATINKEKLLSTEKLRAAFSLFDKDNSGSISGEEVKEILCSGQKIDDKVWEEVIREVDSDGNGEIDFEEFTTMMQKLLQK
jgi:Ca2+-binding EF-hand superfamily protein